MQKKYDQVVFFNPPGLKGQFKWRLKIKRWFQKKGWNPDRRHLVERYAGRAGIQIKNKKGRFYFNDKDHELAERFLKENGIASDDFVIFISHITGGSRFLKSWTIKNFEQLVARVQADVICKIIVGGSQDDPEINADFCYLCVWAPVKNGRLPDKKVKPVHRNGFWVDSYCRVF